MLMLAACSDGGDGAVLSFTAPEGPGEASRIELVLASPSDEAMTATRQRKRPGDLAEEDVVYFRQRATVDAILGVRSVDGFEVRIEPDPSIVADTKLIPFALIYDADDALIGVGSVHDDNGEPTHVLIKEGVISNHAVTVLPLVPDDEAKGILDGQGRAIACATDGAAWASGVVWKRPEKPQLRLLFPDRAADPDATDAMERDSDLDCDEHEADARDCDDLRSAYRPGQTETCDGNDTDCDGRPVELIEGCNAPNNTTCSTSGVSLCSEAPGGAASATTCTPSASCGCIPGNLAAGCGSCTLGYTQGAAGGDASVCAPAAGKLHIASCPAPGCSIEIVGVTGPWEVHLAPDEGGGFQGSKLTGILTDYFYLRARYLGTATFSLNTTSIGEVYVAIIGDPDGPRLMSINLGLDDPRSTCTPGTMGNNLMRCLP